ncbi:MAG: potassium/proton antiporter, partial [Anaerolineales bacterium]|nr:potassium/proton antiporter [Anaerolineales bacterium]
MLPIDHVLLAAAALVLLSVLASQTSGRLGLPALILFLVLGMLAGSEGLGGIEFDDPWAAQLLASAALAYILFSGGLDTQWSQVLQVLWSGLALSSLGVVLTAVGMMFAARLLFGFDWLQGLLLGGIISSTDAAAVFTTLRSKGVRLHTRLQRLLEFESGSNDPMAVFLTIGLTTLLVNPQRQIWELVPSFLLQMSLGVALGFALGRAMIWMINHFVLHFEGLYPVLTSSMVLLTFGLSSTVGGNGFLAVYVAGMVASEADFLHKRSLLRFHDGLAWLMQILMFLTLGLLVFPSRLVSVMVPGLVLAGVLIFVARPLATALVLTPFGFTWKEKVLTGWVGLRGAVPIVLATFPLLAGVPESDTIFNL